jgi:hypothetical protein
MRRSIATLRSSGVGDSPRLGADGRRKLPVVCRVCCTYLGEALSTASLMSEPVLRALVSSKHRYSLTRSDVTPRSDPQLSRAAALITSSLSFIHDLRNGYLKPDDVRGMPLDMSQYQRLFATCRVPTDVSCRERATGLCQKGCRMEVHSESKHIVVIRRGQFCEWITAISS